MNRMLFCLMAASLAACGPTVDPATDSADEPATAGDERGDEPGRDEALGEAPDGAPAPSTSAEAVADPAAHAVLAAHNARRAEHCADPLSWSDELAQVAQAWADEVASRGCTLQHSSGPYGENLAAGSAGTLSPEQVVEMWYGESSQYRYRGGGFSMQTGHFTQVVWAETARVGCGMTTCNGMDVFVCNYDPPGNVSGGYEDNVRPTSCR